MKPKSKPSNTKADAMSFTAALPELGLTAHAEQITVVERLQTVSSAGQIGFIEAPTATGKTLTIAYHALRQAASAEEAFIIAVPTIELAHQTATAIASVQSTMNDEIPVGIIVGKHEFLSKAGLLDLCEHLPADSSDAVKAWIADGAPGRSPAHPCWTRDGLDQWLRANDFFINLSNHALILGPSDAGTESDRSYHAQFGQAHGILLVTHAMLARDLMTRFVATSRNRRKAGMQIDPRLSPQERWLLANLQRLEVETGDEGRLPDYRQIIIDEAHLMRDIFESSMRTGISLSMLVSQISALSKSSKGLVPAQALKEIKAIKAELSKSPKAQKGERIEINWNRETQFHQILSRLDTAIDLIKVDKAADDLEHQAIAIKRAKYAIQESLRARDSVSTIFEWSPVKSFPTISVGRRNLGSQFNLFWERLQSAALISATLYTENVTGPSVDYIAGRLSVPVARKQTFAPIPASWIKDSVTAMLPSRDTALELEPGNDKQRLDAIAQQIASIDSETGMLVLSTSRADTQGLAKRLAQLTSPDRIIDGAEHTLSANKLHYIAKVKAGRKPIWLAQGPAWTGLDLADQLIDNLVITRIPFPVPDAIREGQKSHYGAHKVNQMAMTFKQGIGRLVRSRTASPKRLWILDGRILDLQSARGALKLVKSYTHKEF